MKSVQLITDGACIRNPGPGGWACILRFKQLKREMWGSAPQSTNNRMELTAAVKGLAALNEPCQVEIVTDSKYLKNGITKWVKGWKQGGWLTKEKQPVLNRDLWEELDALNSKHQTKWTWTKGHASHEDNNRCDELATRAARELSHSR